MKTPWFQIELEAATVAIEGAFATARAEQKLSQSANAALFEATMAVRRPNGPEVVRVNLRTKPVPAFDNEATESPV